MILLGSLLQLFFYWKIYIWHFFDFIWVNKVFLEDFDGMFEMSLYIEVWKAWENFKSKVVVLGEFDSIENWLVEVKTGLI